MRNKSVWRGLLLAGLLNLSPGSTVALADNTALTQKLAALEKSTGGRLGVAGSTATVCATATAPMSAFR